MQILRKLQPHPRSRTTNRPDTQVEKALRIYGDSSRQGCYPFFNCDEMAKQFFHEKRDRIILRLQQAIDDHIFPGCVIGVVDECGQKLLLPLGHATYLPDAEAVGCDTLFDVASITKSIPVSTLCLIAIEKQLCSVSTPVITFVPELRMNHRADITVWHLLTHTLDFGYTLSALKDVPAAQIRDHILSTNLWAAPGTSFFYSNATSILLGMAVERIFGDSLDKLADTMIFSPLAMHRTTFDPSTFDVSEIMPTEEDPWRGFTVRGRVHDESAYVLGRIMCPGSAGLFSTAPDLLAFLRMLLNGGNRVLKPATIFRLQVNQLSAIGQSAALGWELNRPHYMGSAASEQTIGKTGFTGCSVVVDFAKKLGLVILSNYTYPHRKPDASYINRVRKDIADIVFGDQE
jgi:CubicO group peptidase (beta-lactamase class C family)